MQALLGHIQGPIRGSYVAKFVGGLAQFQATRKMVERHLQPEVSWRLA